MPSKYYERNKKVKQLSEGAADGGDAAKFRLFISRITMNNGSELKLPTGGVTVVVGGNNSGKSTFLRDIELKLGRSPYSIYNPLLIDRIDLVREGSDSDAFSWLEANVGWHGKSSTPGFRYGRRFAVSEGEVKKFLMRGEMLDGSLGQLNQFFVQQGDLHKRIEIVKPAEQRERLDDNPQHPLHWMQDDPELLNQMKEYVRRIFRQEVTLDRLGRKVQLRVGTTDAPAPPVDAVTSDYTNAMAKLPTLDEQGDGMKSLLGLLLPLFTSHGKIMLIDEPEAFLHPPQARLAGRVLGELAAERDAQIILATHDRNLLVGLLESGAPLSVVRLDRRSEETNVQQLDHERVRLLWTDPNLRYGNVLDGLFHRAVVLAEADSDCQFYAAALDVADIERKLSFSPGDVLSLPVGGKSALSRVSASLKAVSVPLVVVADMDLLNDRTVAGDLIHSLGANWSSFETDYKKATQPFRSPRSTKTRAQVLTLVRQILDEDTTRPYDKETEALVRAAISADRSPWQDLKDYGVAAFRGGLSRQAAESLLSLLSLFENIGLVLVRDGELERLAPRVASRKGTEWLQRALATQAYADQPAQEHIAHVATALASQMGIVDSVNQL